MLLPTLFLLKLSYVEASKVIFFIKKKGFLNFSFKVCGKIKKRKEKSDQGTRVKNKEDHKSKSSLTSPKTTTIYIFR